MGERVIVSQIIRSPGIYFEKNKNQKKRKKVKRFLSTDINKLRSFVPIGEPFLSEQILFFPKNLKNERLLGSSYNHLKTHKNIFNAYLLESFKIYRIISKTEGTDLKNKRIKLFLHWLKLKNRQIIRLNNFQSQQ